MDNYYYWFIDLGQIEKNHAGMEYESVELCVSSVLPNTCNMFTGLIPILYNLYYAKDNYKTFFFFLLNYWV